jgi:chromosome segregation ATPase
MKYIDNITDDYFREYKDRYNQYWIRRWGMIPHLPTSLDNSQSIYELLAWLQRAFKDLLDDFINQSLEFEEFKNNLTNLLEELIPDLIRQFVKSDEFKNIILKIIRDWYEEELKPIIDKMQNEINNNKEEIEKLKNSIGNLVERLNSIDKELQNINNKIDNLEQQIKNLQGSINDGQIDDDLLNFIKNLYNNLKDRGLIDGNYLKDGLDFAIGNINLFGQDEEHFIRTSKANKENDLIGGI